MVYAVNWEIAFHGKRCAMECRIVSTNKTKRLKCVKRELISAKPMTPYAVITINYIVTLLSVLYTHMYSMEDQFLGLGFEK